MPTLEEMTHRGSASIKELSDALNSNRFSRVGNSELIAITNHLFNFPTAIIAVTEHPNYNLKGYDLAIYYHTVTGNLSEGLAAGQVLRLDRIKRLMSRYVREDEDAANRPHTIVTPENTDIAEVKRYFKGLDIYDGRKFTALLDGITLALQCPDIVDDARNAFGSRWYAVKNFHADYKWKIKAAMDLRDDGRKEQFLQGVHNLNHYLRTH